MLRAPNRLRGRRPACLPCSSRAGAWLKDRVCGASREAGFSLIELVMAMTLFAIVSTALGGVLTAAMSARSTALEKTKAEQIANTQLEWIRSLDYLQVGLTSTGQVRGDIDPTGNQASQNGPTVPAGYAVIIKVSWVDDPTPTSYSAYASYKNVLVTVYRAGDTKELTHQSTQVGPRSSSTFGGINAGVIEAIVMDYYSGGVGPMADVNVTLGTGPSAPLDETSNANGAVRFRGLDPTTATGTTTHYDLDVAAASGWVLVANPLATHLTLAPGQTVGPKTLYVYKPLTLSIPLFNADGTPFTGTATIKVENTRGSVTLAYTGTPLTVTSIVNTATGLSEPLVPEPYTITVLSGMPADSLTVPVPADYPTTLTLDGSVTAKVVGALTTTVMWGGQPVSGATVQLTGGPNSISLSAVTNAAGVASFADVNAGSGYTLTATKSGESGTTSATVVANTNTNVTITMPVGGLLVTVIAAGNPLPGALVRISAGPMSLPVTSDTTNASGEVTFTGLPAGSGYTLSAEKSGSTTTTVTAVTGGTTTNVTLTWPLGSLEAHVTWLSANVAGAQVQLTGGPFGISPPAQTTPANGKVTFTNVPEGTGYTLTATKNGQTGTASAAATGGSTTTAPVAMPTGTIALGATNLTWAGEKVTSANVSITGGPMAGSYTGTTNASGVLSLTVPTTNATYPYTVTVTKNGYTATATVTSLAAGATATPTVTFASTGTIALTAATLTWAGTQVPSATVTITGGPNSGVTYTGTTDGAGAGSVIVPMTTSGFPYTVTVTKNGGTRTVTVTSLASGGTASPTVTMTPTGTISLTATNVTWAGKSVGSASVTVSGGPNGVDITGTTSASGVLSLTVPATTGSFPYTVTVTKNGGSGSRSVAAPTSGATVSPSPALTLTPTKTITITVQGGGTNLSGIAVRVSITGGPNGTVGANPFYGTGTTSSMTTGTGVNVGKLAPITVPSGAGGYTVKVWRVTCSGTGRSVAVAGVSSTGTTDTPITVNMTASTPCPFAPLP